MPGRSWLGQVGALASRGRSALDRGATGRRMDGLEALCRRLLAQRGEAASVALAGEILDAIGACDRLETASFLGLLSRAFDPERARVDAAIAAWREGSTPERLQALILAVEPPRQELFRRLNQAAGGTRAIVDLRATLLDLLADDPSLENVDADLRHLLGSWFNRGFLHLEEIGWHTPADVLERLIRYEAVHEIRGWDDLRRRLAADRRCYAFFHPALPGEPIIFVEVALTRGLAGHIGPLLDPRREVADARKADTAIFYSISNCQRGLRGISFGDLLIKQVVAELSRQLPSLERFATLSPLPGFAAALARHDDPAGFTDARIGALAEGEADDLRRLSGKPDVVEACLALAARPGAHAEPVGRVLERLALAYLMHVRRGSRAVDPVAHFHLSNGARLERIAVDADPSPRGAASCGVMVNYLYEPDQLDANHERYVEGGRLTVGRHLGGLARRVGAAWSRSP